MSISISSATAEQKYNPMVLSCETTNEYVTQKSNSSASVVRFCNSSLIWAIVFLVIVGPLSAAQIVIGVVNLESCKVKPMIPLWLIVSGAFNVILIMWHLLRIVNWFLCKYKSSNLAYFGFIWILLAFIWFLMGNIWVFSMKPIDELKEEKQSANMDCDHLTYLFSFWYIISAYIVTGVVFVCLLSCCTIGYLIQKHPKNEF